ncbi:carboxymuconolactone decarboxylase family protein [Streptomyces sp. NPDC048434]|uniref:carboxymuconolactone decarboxylase family protein n=1 Tax=Streptomyces sp. NPDC048434 TaxID=3365549 RepID=UPI003712ABF7
MTNETQMSEAGAGNKAADPVTGASPANEAVNGAGNEAVVRSPRVNFARAAPKAFKALIGFDAAAREGLDPALVELVQIRSSQLNKCAYCLHMHTSDARKAGESAERLHMVAVWEEAAHFFTAKERAALALTEAVTLVARGGVPDEVYERAARHFDEAELARLLALIFTINTWNRIAISTGKVPGTDER